MLEMMYKLLIKLTITHIIVESSSLVLKYLLTMFRKVRVETSGTKNIYYYINGGKTCRVVCG